ncbi:agamous-like MADS-box protein AGL62 [Rosa rugosa]|uniref:agamous-like MADS-box protein AGL62 n=1 Tax=Rosa rugosa TaxID=74645 RepID=UPI002B402DFF|nr:agamous-like MADS-box protein AGL62 [Rosa rugosa]
MGRQRIEVHKLEKASNRQVTFSKRRFGVFKKASELCTLSGAEIALIVDSPAKKTYSFGYPSMEAVIDRYENMNAPLANNSNTEQLMEAACRRQTHDLMAELDAINEDLHKETLKRKVLNKKEKAGQAQNWYERSVDCINDKEQLNFFKNVLRELGDMVAQHSEMLRQKQVGLMQQNAGMVQQAELMQQNTTIGAIRDFMQPRALHATEGSCCSAVL